MTIVTKSAQLLLKRQGVKQRLPCN